MSDNKMKIEIWSDIMCPFCYIGKRKFESALANFEFKNDLEIEWKSFQLNPNLETNLDISISEYLAEAKGMSIDEAASLNDRVASVAEQVGLTFNFDKAVVANSLNAHRFLHFAKQHAKQNEAEELLFKSYFTDGKNIDDHNVLLDLATSLGLDSAALDKALKNGGFTEDVQLDVYQSQQLGVRGVPFFAFDRKYGVSGAQESDKFLEVLQKSYKEWKDSQLKNNLDIIGGNSCDIDGNCN